MVSLLRSAVMVFVLFIGIKLTKIELKLPKMLWKFGAINGILMAAMTYGNIGAIEFISIGMAQLIFFTFPVLIALIVAALGLESVTKMKLTIVFVAFLGLMLMLINAPEKLDWRGVTFALIASISTAVNAVLVAKYFRQINPFLSAFYFSLMALFVLAGVGIVTKAVVLPNSALGWGGAIGVAVLQTVGTPMYLYAIAQVGALKTGMGANIQPVFAILMAWILFGEVLSLQQSIGGLLVLLSITSLPYLDLIKK